MKTFKGHIELSGAKNFRDFGGYQTQRGRRVKQRQLYRADSLSALSDADLSAIRALDINTVCDLRRSEERTHSPSRWPADASTIFHHLPFFHTQSTTTTADILGRAQQKNSAEASRQIMLQVYRSMVTDAHAVTQMAKIFQLLADAGGLPLLLHCSGGKDRTGVSCALILTLLGVAPDDVMADYMLSLELYSNQINQKLQSHGQVYDTKKIGGVSPEALLPIYQVHPDYLQAAFDAVQDQYGGVDRFFTRGLQLTEDCLDNIRNQLTE